MTGGRLLRLYSRRDILLYCGTIYFKITNPQQKEFCDIINSVYADIIELSKKEFLKSNVSRMNIHNETWRLFFIRGAAINKRDFYFYKINKGN